MEDLVTKVQTVFKSEFAIDPRTITLDVSPHDSMRHVALATSLGRLVSPTANSAVVTNGNWVPQTEFATPGIARCFPAIATHPYDVPDPGQPRCDMLGLSRSWAFCMLFEPL